MSPILRNLLIVCLLTGAVSAQLDWRMQRRLGFVPEMCMDPLRGRLVGMSWVNGSPTPFRMFEWDARFWTHPAPAVGPTYLGTLAWDPVQGRILYLSNDQGSPLQTWSWDGQTWIQHTPATNPPFLDWGSRMATDFARGRVVYFGGWPQPTGTWEWDGTNWAQRFPANSPSSRSGFAMAWNPSRNRITLHGGANGNVLSDTWEWDGTNWSLRATNGPPRNGAGLGAAPNGGLVLFGGASSGTGMALATTWTWDGTNWTQRFPVNSPGPQARACLALDAVRGVTILLSQDAMVAGELWEWNGQDWLQRARGIPECESVVGDPQRGRVVAYGWSYTTPLTYEWDGSEWRRFFVSGPSYRREAAMAYAGNGQTLLFSGEDPQLGQPFADTWIWNGVTWTLQNPVTSPPGRHDHAMAFDAARGEVVLFGGNNTLADTWTWNGSNWTQRNPATQPTGRAWHAMANDPVRSVVVLFGGRNPQLGQYFADTWEWNGVNWQLVPTSSGPPALTRPMLVTSPDGQGVLLYGGSIHPGGGDYTQLQHWDGTFWTPLAITVAPGSGSGALDTVHGHVVMQGEAGIWLLDGPSHADVTPFGIGCPGSAGRPTLGIARDWPFLGNNFTLEVCSVPSSAAVLLVMGSSADQFGSVALPMDLAGLGMPQCLLHISMEADAWLVATNGVASHTLAVPMSPGLIGLELFAQAAAVDPAANAAGLSASNGLRLRVGQ